MASREPGGRPRVVVVGAASRDVDERDPRGWRLGGSVTYGALTAARLRLKVHALVGTDDDAAGAWELDAMRSAGIDLRCVRLPRGPVFHNRVVDGGRVQLALQESDRVPAAELPSAWRTASGMLLVPVAGELDDSWAEAVRPGVLLALGWQGLLRRIAAGRLVEPLPLYGGALARRADIAVVSAEDAVAGGPPLAQLLTRPGQQMAVTNGALGALHVERTGDDARPLRFRRVPAIAAGRVVDPTGAGDVFLAAWCAARLSAPAAETWRAMSIASAAGSATVEIDSPTKLPTPYLLGQRLVRRPSRGRASAP